MQVYRSLAEVPAGMRSVATIGIFDGVHTGHRRVIREVVSRARALGCAAVALTFDPHPLTLHRPDADIRLIMPLPDRVNALAAMGLDAVWVEPYTWDLAGLGPREFVRRYFVDALGARCVVVGSDVRFGRDNAGDLATLRQLGRDFGFEVAEVADVRDPAAGRRLSSTWVRELLGRGDVHEAARVLGHPYRLRGTVIRGFQRGRRLGFPTANLDATRVGTAPADGVYAGWLICAAPAPGAVQHLPAAISVGTNPQFSGQKRTVEAHVLGRADLNLYGQSVAIDFVKRLRGMLKLNSVEALLEQMDDDLRECADALGVPPTGRIDPAAVTAQ